MPADPEYLKSHYSSLSDEALLAVDRDDLVDLAQKLYDAELNARELSRDTSDEPDDMSDQDVESEPAEFDAEDASEWLDEAAEVYSVVESSGTTAEDAASSARAMLEAANIPCHLDLVQEPEENTPARGRWRLMVPGNFNLQATSTLERDLFNQEFETGWKTYLEVLSDDDLRALRPETVLCGLFDRLERVTRAYNEEIARRRL